jgi:hypothetical protein
MGVSGFLGWERKTIYGCESSIKYRVPFCNKISAVFVLFEGPRKSYLAFWQEIEHFVQYDLGALEIS